MRKISSMLHSCSVNILSGSGVWLVLLMLLTFGIYGIESNYFNYTPLSHHKEYTDTSNAITTSNSAKRILPIYCVDTNEPKVAISFDCAWGNESTRTILDILKKHNVKATFFMTGSWVNAYPEDVKTIASEGHDLGNHSENHKHMSELSLSDCEKEIMSVHNTVKELTGIDMNLFRPPYGDYNNTSMTAVQNTHYYGIQWDVDSLDWKDYGVESIISTVINHKALTNGSIILMHNGSKFTPDALEEVIVKLKEKGYEIVPISQLIYKSDYTIDVQGRQHKN